MLHECAPGHRFTTTDHFHVIRFKGRTYPSFSKGRHKKTANPEIPLNKVRQMVGQLELSMECVKRHFPQLA